MENKNETKTWKITIDGESETVQSTYEELEKVYREKGYVVKYVDAEVETYWLYSNELGKLEIDSDLYGNKISGTIVEIQGKTRS